MEGAVMKKMVVAGGIVIAFAGGAFAQAPAPAAPSAPAPAVPPAASAAAPDLAAGEQSFKKCLTCHSVGEDARNKVGPVLNGLEGRKSGTIEGFSYSEANKAAAITWNQESFLDYIKDPRAKIPGTKMVFAGIKNEKE